MLYPTAYVDLTGTVQSIDMTNTTYAYLSMLNGDSFAHKFGPGDYFLLDVKKLFQKWVPASKTPGKQALRLVFETVSKKLFQK